MAQTKQIGHNMSNLITASHSINGWLATDLQGNEGKATFAEGKRVAVERCKDKQSADEVPTVKEARKHKAKIATKYDTFEVKRY